ARLEVARSISAGDDPGPTLRDGEAARIFTGAPVPPGAWGVVMQEDCEARPRAVVVKGTVDRGQNIRRSAEEVRPGDEVLGSGYVVGAGPLAVLASQGIAEVACWRAPNVAILVVGDELAAPGQEPAPYQIRETNGLMLAEQCRAAGAGRVERRLLADQRQVLAVALAEFVRASDLVLIAGGASVGDKDFSRSLLAEMGELVFAGVSIKPGGPVLHGRVAGTPVFGLPGNPGSAFVCFELFVREAIRRLAGWAHPEPIWLDVPCEEARTPRGRDEFVRARFVESDGRASTCPVGIQGSFALGSLTQAECLVRLQAGVARGPGDPAPTLMLER
ncbi:MAG: molybdopterin molybdotransferase MoeA, partial [Fimbriimonas ginsengisoli]|nr:molybdopterin molybdotransferase MoeA [Fimbriimonas ginsengisoli]